MLFIWIFISLVQTPQLFSGLDNLITDQIYYFLDNFFGSILSMNLFVETMQNHHPAKGLLYKF